MPNKTLRDIAIEIGINVNTLKSRIYRAEMVGIIGLQIGALRGFLIIGTFAG